eukprot:1161486-Pelagomonas_calceolata.AAC.13
MAAARLCCFLFTDCWLVDQNTTPMGIPCYPRRMLFCACLFAGGMQKPSECCFTTMAMECPGRQQTERYARQLWACPNKSIFLLSTCGLRFLKSHVSNISMCANACGSRMGKQISAAPSTQECCKS